MQIWQHDMCQKFDTFTYLNNTIREKKEKQGEKEEKSNIKQQL